MKNLTVGTILATVFVGTIFVLMSVEEATTQEPPTFSMTLVDDIYRITTTQVIAPGEGVAVTLLCADDRFIPNSQIVNVDPPLSSNPVPFSTGPDEDTEPGGNTGLVIVTRGWSATIRNTSTSTITLEVSQMCAKEPLR